jgi:hypothetical protein
MKKSNQFILLAMVMSLTVFSTLGAEPVSEVQNVPKTVAASETSSSEAEGILYMREEEKLARDVYLALYDIWGIKTFSNIAKSEQKHMDAVATLIQAQGLVDPVAGSAPGEFMNPHLADLYASLVEQGSKSPQDALIVGAIIEDLDIYDLENYLMETQDPDAIAVYTNLLKGSENHFSSFSKQLAKYNLVYEARYSTQARLDGILSR